MASTGKELPSWLSADAVLLYAILMVCVHFPFGVRAGCGIRFYYIQISEIQKY